MPDRRRPRRRAPRPVALGAVIVGAACGAPARPAPPANRPDPAPRAAAPPPPEPWFHDKPDAFADCVAPTAAPVAALPPPFARCDATEEAWASPPGGNELHFHYRAFSAAVTTARRARTPGVCCYLVWEFPRE